MAITTRTWSESYFGQLRTLAGDRTLLLTAARMVVRDPTGRLLLVCRRDNDHWSAPAGPMELGESIEECAVRQLRQHTGLHARTLVPFAMHTGPERTYRNESGDTYQHFVVLFQVREWYGELARATDETVDAGFFPDAALPTPLASNLPETLSDLAAFDASGRLVVK